jgi:hypothetical protein
MLSNANNPERLVRFRCLMDTGCGHGFYVRRRIWERVDYPKAKEATCNTLGGQVGPLVSYLSNNRSCAGSSELSMGE